ncbi:MAG TPA: hypothetical protein VNX66_05965 [Candidatus Sulfotelmatobacter sp.]|jgi:hypothetical protein|nr:hypothetical protein [Candidatus Sulfotelmatobacter sp.]
MNASKRILSALLLAGATICVTPTAKADDQTKTGAGNPAAIALAKKSPLVQSAYKFLLTQAAKVKDDKLRKETLDALGDAPCVRHRANLTDAQKDSIIQTLIAQKLVNPVDAASLNGGVKAGIFPALVNDGSACPKLPQKFFSAPGSTSVFGHHSYPGGLVVHESNNETADVHLATEYREIYGNGGRNGLPTVDPDDVQGKGGHDDDSDASGIFINEDLIIGAPLWHDWAKPMVFQWNANGTEFVELNFGGFGTTDNFGGAAGDSRTGGHHIITIAEEMTRGLSPEFVITQACAHSAPTSGNEYKVVNWLRAGAIIAQIDPVAKGYLSTDTSGNFRLPALRQLGNDVNLVANGQTNVLAEYTLHNLSDADFTYSGPAVDIDNVILAEIAPEFGYNSTDANYFTSFRNPVMSFFSAERLTILYSEKGTDGVRQEVKKLHQQGVL